MMLKGKHCRDTGWICLCCLILFVGMPMQAASISNATLGDSLLADTLNPLLSVPSQPIPDKLPVEHTFLHLFDELPQDSVMFLRQESRFSRLSPFWQISIPVTLTGVAAWGLSESGGMAKFRHKLRREFMKISGQKKIRIDDYLQYAPFGSFLWGGILPGVPHRHILRDRLLLGITSYVLMGGLVNGIASANFVPTSRRAIAFPPATQPLPLWAQSLLEQNMAMLLGREPTWWHSVWEFCVCTTIAIGSMMF